MSNQVANDEELDAVGRHFEPNLPTECVCMVVSHCGVTWDAVLERAVRGSSNHLWAQLDYISAQLRPSITET